MRSGKNQFEMITIEKLKTRALEFGLYFCDKNQNYKNSKEKIDFFDKEGFKFSLCYGQIKNIPHKFQKNKYAIYNLKKYIEVNNIKVVLISTEYHNCKEKLKFKCECGNVFERTLDCFVNKQSYCCQKCSNFKVGDKNRLSYHSFSSNIKDKGYKILGGYKNSVFDILLIEDKEGYRYTRSYHNIMTNESIYRFYPSNEMSIYNIVHYIKKNKIKSKLISKKWVSAYSLMNFKCECGEKFSTSWSVFMNGKNRCNKCTKVISNIENMVKEYLDFIELDYEQQYSFDDLKHKNKLSFDFAIFKNRKLCYLIEVQGLQHYKPVNFGQVEDKSLNEIFELQLYKDDLKRKYCLKNNIPLLELKYSLFKNNEYKNKLNLFNLAH